MKIKVECLFESILFYSSIQPYIAIKNVINFRQKESDNRSLFYSFDFKNSHLVYKACVAFKTN